jgi:hypothetical protein
VLEDREWHGAEGASSAAVVLLNSVAPVDLPESYYSLLSFSNGGEGPLPVQPLWLSLYPAAEVVQIERDGTFREFFAKLFVISGNGGGEAVAFDLRKRTLPDHRLRYVKHQLARKRPADRLILRRCVEADRPGRARDGHDEDRHTAWSLTRPRRCGRGCRNRATVDRAGGTGLRCSTRRLDEQTTVCRSSGTVAPNSARADFTGQRSAI